jgi:hypothetical protein
MWPNYFFFLLPFSARERQFLDLCLSFFDPFLPDLIDSFFNLLVIATIPVIIPENLIK